MKKYLREEYDSTSTAQKQQLYELQKKTWLIKIEKTPESSKALEARVTAIEAKPESSSNENIFPDEKHRANN